MNMLSGKEGITCSNDLVFAGSERLLKLKKNLQNLVTFEINKPDLELRVSPQ